MPEIMNSSGTEPVDDVPSLDDLNSYERARQLLSAVIAAYSARIGAADAEQAAELRGRRAPLLAEQQTLDPRDRDRVREIIAGFPVLLVAVREDAE
ncbi:hypothetical protein [Streptomyces sp. NPDC002276]